MLHMAFYKIGSTLYFAIIYVCKSVLISGYITVFVG